MKAVIIAAGRGRRLDGRKESKPLISVHGRPLIEWVILSANRAGIRDFLVVTGYAADSLERHLTSFCRETGLAVSFVRNDDWEKENGLSVAKAGTQAGNRFVLLMADHIFDPDILLMLTSQALRADEIMLAVDFNIQHNPLVDMDDVTKVLVEKGKIAEIGKTIKSFNAFDTGLFLCTPAIFQGLGESQAKGDFTLSGGVRALAGAGKARVMNVDGGCWVDVDDERALEKAERLLASRPDLCAGVVTSRPDQEKTGPEGAETAPRRSGNAD